MRKRFFLPSSAWNSQPVVLEGAEARHCLEVLRARNSEMIEVFDGEGRMAEARLVGSAKRTAWLDLGPSRMEPAETPAITVGFGLTKMKSLDLILQKATELGANRLQPLATAHTVVRLSSGKETVKQEKWRQILIEAAKQCRRNRLPEIAPVRPVKEWLEGLPSGGLRLVASLNKGARPMKNVLPKTCPQDSCTILIGPEGDFTGEEYRSAEQHGFLPVSLGPRILRSETAVCFALSVLRFHFDDPPFWLWLSEGSLTPPPA